MDPRTGHVSCDICRRGHHPQKLPFFCAVDARNALYETRIANARVLMEIDEIDQRLNGLLHESQPDSSASTPNRTSCLYVENCAAEEQRAKARTEQIIATAERLQSEVDEARREIRERKAAMERRKADLVSVSQGIATRRTRELEETRKSTKMTKYHWDREHDATAQYRAALCAEVAKLYRLQRVRRGNPVRFEYKIGGLEVVELHHLNSKKSHSGISGSPSILTRLIDTHPEHVSASLGHIAHLLWLASYYLAVRLPAEITLPHNDYPRPTIFSLSSSYHHGHVRFPGASPLPFDSLERQYGNVPHPRPLFLDKPLASFTKEESNNYTAFLEGVCLLAYNIVWLCRTQGIPVGDNNNSFEDFSSMGRNLYNLLIGSSLQRNQPGQPLIDTNAPSPTRNSSAGGSSEAGDLAKTAPKMGIWSHGTSHTSLNSPTGHDFTRSFKLPNPIKLADKLKARLAQEAPVPEWELIEGDEFGPTDLDDGVLIGGTPLSRKRVSPRYGLESYMSINTVRSNGSPEVTRGSPSTTAASTASSGPGKEKEKERSLNGWTKIKPR
jgi:hypothetical protein